MAKELTYEEIKGGIMNWKFMPVYLFQGDEPYFIDKLTDLLIDHALDESERDFNQTIVYGLDTEVSTVINACRRYPMMAARQLVVVKEAQNLKKIDELAHYVANPQPTTILVLNYKYGKLDGRKKLASDIAKKGIVFDSKKLYDNQIPSFINGYLLTKQVIIDAKSAQMLADYLGNNLSKLTNEIDKLIISLPENQRRITPELIEKNIGISKDFNNFELQSAIANKDVLKANQIIRYFAQNPKNNPVVVTMTTLYNFFSNLMICLFSKDRSVQNVKNLLELRFDFQATDYMNAMKHYNAFKTLEIVALLREYDAKCKGVGNTSVSDGELMKELIYKIMH